MYIIGTDDEVIDLDLIFKMTAGLKLSNLSSLSFLCAISRELINEFLPNLLRYIIGIGNELKVFQGHCLTENRLHDFS